ncbi:MAG: hypothetical protein NTU70_08620 [Methylococcales bacterium]|nr:hypothetical protein [Methylococcales bacterium]
MNTKIKMIGGAIVALFMIGGGQALALQPTEKDYNLKLLGKYLFFDNLSDPQTQSCSSCHTPSAGWTGGDSKVNETVVAVPGARSGKIGNLRPPSNAYASLVHKFEILCTHNTDNKPSTRPCGGNFWNGRALGKSADSIEANLKTNPNNLELKGLDRDAVESVAGLWDKGHGLRIFTEDQEEWTKYLGPTADQAHASPLINPVEQGLENKAAVCALVKTKSYAALYQQVWGEPLNCKEVPFDAVDITFARFAVALAAYQQSKDVNAFDSKRDRALRKDHDGKFPLDDFDDQENLGHDLFYNTNKLSGLVNPTIVLPLKTPTLPATTLSKDDTAFNTAAQAIKVYPNLPVTNCTTCHSPTGKNDPAFLKAASLADIGPKLGINPKELFTDLSYHNIGSPHNYETPGEHDNLADPSIIQLANLTGNDGSIPTKLPNQKGMVKVPILRNVDKRSSDDFVKAYGHNGWFKSLKGIVHFYNTSANRGDLKNPTGEQLEPDAPHTCTKTDGGADQVATEKEALANNCWPVAENDGGSARKMGGGGLTGDMGMNDKQEAALVAYLKTLSDIPTPSAPKPFDLKSFHEGALE